jgi:tetratricopeptide (TPR) repeat protein
MELKGFAAGPAASSSSVRSLKDALSILGWRPEHLAERLNTLAKMVGRPETVHPKTPYNWRDEGDHPRRPWPTLIVWLLNEHLPTPLTAADLGWRTSEDLVSAADGLMLPWNAAGGLRALRVVTDAEDMQRRMFLTLLGATLTAPAHDWLLAYAAEDTAHATGTDLPVEIIDELDLITAGLRRMDDQLGGGNLQPLVSVHLRAVIDLIENRHYNESTGRRLHATAAELLRLGGFLAFDAGHHAQAQRYWVAALHTAHAAADRGLGANILGFMSCQAKDLGQTREAITLAETARSGYPVTAPRVQAILDLRAAEAYAVGADLSNCRRAIDAAFNRFSDPTPDHGEPGWSYWLDIPHAHGQAGYCYLRLGEWDAARRHLRAAIQGQGVTISREGALRQVLMATTYVRQTHPDIEKGLDLGNRALDTLTQQVSSARVIGHVSRLSDYLAPYRQNPAVKAFNNRTREITRSQPAT